MRKRMRIRMSGKKRGRGTRPLCGKVNVGMAMAIVCGQIGGWAKISLSVGKVRKADTDISASLNTLLN